MYHNQIIKVLMSIECGLILVCLKYSQRDGGPFQDVSFKFTEKRKFNKNIRFSGTAPCPVVVSLSYTKELLALKI